MFRIIKMYLKFQIREKQHSGLTALGHEATSNSLPNYEEVRGLAEEEEEDGPPSYIQAILSKA